MAHVMLGAKAALRFVEHQFVKSCGATRDTQGPLSVSIPKKSSTARRCLCVEWTGLDRSGVAVVSCLGLSFGTCAMTGVRGACLEWSVECNVGCSLQRNAEWSAKWAVEMQSKCTLLHVSEVARRHGNEKKE